MPFSALALPATSACGVTAGTMVPCVGVVAAVVVPAVLSFSPDTAVPSFATTEVLTCGAAFAAPGVATAAAAEAASATSAVTPVTADTTGAVMASPTAAWASVFAPLVAAAFAVAAGVVA